MVRQRERKSFSKQSLAMAVAPETRDASVIDTSMRLGNRIAALCSVLIVAASAGFTHSATLVDNVHVLTMQDGAMLQRGAVLIEGGRIAAVGERDSLTMPQDVQVIDGEGGYLLPGLTDMHSHIMSPESLTLQLVYGVTTIRNMWGRDDILAMRAEEQRGELLAPDIETTSPLLDGDPPYFPGSLTLTDPAEVPVALRELREKGYSALKPYELLPHDIYVAMAAEADKHGMTIEGHIPQAVDAAEAIRLGHDTVEHFMRFDAYIIDPQIPFSTSFRPRELVELISRIDAGELTYEEAFSRDKLRELARLMVEHDTAVVPTLGVLGILSYSKSDREAMVEHPLLQYVNPAFRSAWLEELPADESGNRDPLTDEEIASLEYYASVEVGKWIGILHEQGVLILAGVDAPNPGMFQGFSLHEELGHLVNRASLSNYEALKTATVNPAKYWGIEGERGVIAQGAEADMLLVSANPLEDISNTQSIVGIMADGVWLDRQRLDALLEDVREAYSKPPSGEPVAGFPLHLH